MPSDRKIGWSRRRHLRSTHGATLAVIALYRYNKGTRAPFAVFWSNKKKRAMSPKNGGQSCVSARADKCQEFARRPDRRRRAARQASLDKVDQGVSVKYNAPPHTKKYDGPIVVEELSTRRFCSFLGVVLCIKPS
jgi:hypothetical protein